MHHSRSSRRAGAVRVAPQPARAPRGPARVHPGEPAAREPAWLLFLAGWLLAGTALDAAGRGDPDARARAPLSGDTSPSDPGTVRGAGARLDLERATPRELRRLPGVGQRRAIAIAQERWRRAGESGGMRLRDVSGIGPATERRIHEWLARER